MGGARTFSLEKERLSLQIGGGMPCGSGPDKPSTSQRAEQCSVDGDSELPAIGEVKKDTAYASLRGGVYVTHEGWLP